MSSLILMALTGTIANPIYDARSRRGIKAVKSFDEGARFTLGASADGGVGINFYQMEDAASDAALIVAAVLASAKPVQPESYSEIAATSPQTFGADRVLDQLFKSGKVTADTIRNANAEIAQADAAAASAAAAKAAPPPPPPPAPPAPPKPPAAPAKAEGAKAAGKAGEPAKT